MGGPKRPEQTGDLPSTEGTSSATWSKVRKAFGH